MALISCPDCEQPVSDAAPDCIHCGRPSPGSGQIGRTVREVIGGGAGPDPRQPRAAAPSGAGVSPGGRSNWLAKAQQPAWRTGAILIGLLIVGVIVAAGIYQYRRAADTRLQSAVHVALIDFNYVPSGYDLRYRVTNKSEKPVAGVRGDVWIEDLFGTVAAVWSLEVQETIPPDSSIVVLRRQYVTSNWEEEMRRLEAIAAGDTTRYAAPNHLNRGTAYKTTWHPAVVVFADGTRMRRRATER